MSELAPSDTAPAAAESPSGSQRLRTYQSILRIAVLLLLIALVAFVLFVPLPHAWRSTWRSKLLDLGHIPLFALVTVALYRNLRLGLTGAFCVATASAGVCELLQAAAHRSADISDFLRGAIGSLIAVLLVTGSRRPHRWVLCTAASVMLLIWPVADATPRLWDAWTAYQAFPVISDFETRWASHRWYKDNATVECVKGLGHVNFFPTTRGTSGIILFPVIQDWSRYRYLCCDFFLPGEMTLLISVRDGRRIVGDRKRFDLQQQYEVGNHKVKIDLQSLARGDEFAPLDLTRIQSFHIVARDLQHSRELILEHVRLE
jgi:hypothetical protein